MIQQYPPVHVCQVKEKKISC